MKKILTSILVVVTVIGISATARAGYFKKMNGSSTSSSSQSSSSLSNSGGAKKTSKSEQIPDPDEYSFRTMHSVSGFDFSLAMWEEKEALTAAEKNYPEFTGQQVTVKGSPASVFELKKWLVWQNLMRGSKGERTSKYSVNQVFTKKLDGVRGIKFGADISLLPDFDVSKPKSGKSTFVRMGEWDQAIFKMAKTGGKWLSITPPEEENEEPATPEQPKEDEGFFAKLGKSIEVGHSDVYTYKIMESKVSEVFGVQVRNISYVFSDDFKFAGFHSEISARPSFSLASDFQQATDIFDGAVKELGPPMVSYKTTDDYAVTRTGIWVTENGVRIDILCRAPRNDATKCTKGIVQVRQLPVSVGVGTAEGASKFFE